MQLVFSRPAHKHVDPKMRSGQMPHPVVESDFWLTHARTFSRTSDRSNLYLEMRPLVTHWLRGLERLLSLTVNISSCTFFNMPWNTLTAKLIHGSSIDVKTDDASPLPPISPKWSENTWDVRATILQWWHHGSKKEVEPWYRIPAHPTVTYDVSPQLKPK